MNFKPHKFIQYALAGTGAVVLIFALLGVFVPTYSFQVETRIKAPLEETFSAYNDTVHMKEWVAHVQEVKLASGLPNTQGCVYHITVAGREKSYLITKEIVNFKLNQLVAYHLKNDALRVNTEVRFEENGEYTDITAYHTVEGRDPYWRSMLLFLRNGIRHKKEADLQRFKTVIENQHLIKNTASVN